MSNYIKYCKMHILKEVGQIRKMQSFALRNRIKSDKKKEYSHAPETSMRKDNGGTTIYLVNNDAMSIPLIMMIT